MKPREADKPIPDHMTPPGSPCSLECQDPGCLDVYDASMTWACVMQDDPGYNLICLRGFGLAASLRVHRSSGHTVSILGESSGSVWTGDGGVCGRGDRLGKEEEWKDMRAANGTEEKSLSV